MNWLNALSVHADNNLSCVLVTVIESEGSAPRIQGTRMVVTSDSFTDTLGGGALELQAIKHARLLLENGPTDKVITQREFILGSDLTQCCGGKVTLQFDCQWANNFIIHVFGAGHVAQEVARIIQRLPCVAIFHDARTDWLEKLTTLSENAFQRVESCQPASYYLIMTHSHELDMELTEAVLTRRDAKYCGLIASKSKAVSFKSRLQKKGFTVDELNQLTAPIGDHFKTGNTPMEVAVAAVADVLHIRSESINSAKR